MRRIGMILAALGVPALTLVAAPTAFSAGPLLSGYGGPGAGAQAIVGATLLNGPGGGSGGSGSGGSHTVGSASSASPQAAAVDSASPSSGRAAGATTGTRHDRSAGRTKGPGRGSQGSGGHAATGERNVAGRRLSGNAGASATTAVTASADASWFSGGDLLALALAVGVLVLIAAATLRLASAGERHE